MTPRQKAVPLILVRAGNLVKIISVPKGTLRAQFIRLGISEGERVTCLERLPGGTIVIQKNRQQIALGHKLAREILVQVE
jgi:Fe2+ transport system protein FeoA